MMIRTHYGVIMFSDLTPRESVVLYRKMRRAHYRARFGWGEAVPNLQMMFDVDDILLDLEGAHGADVIDKAILSARDSGKHRTHTQRALRASLAAIRRHHGEHSRPW